MLEEEWEKTLTVLRRIGLLYKEDPSNPGTLDLHPLIRAYFTERLKNNDPNIWIEANSRLYEYFKSIAKDLPNTLEEMEPLFLSVIFACRANRFTEALHDVYLPRIMRDDSYYASNKLGAFGTLLYILSHFFEDGNWEKPYITISDSDKYLIYREVGQYLTSTRGYADPEVGKCYSIARTLCNKLNNINYIF